MTNYKEIPVLLLVFNRPDTTKILIEKLKEIKAENIFISQDWARNKEELQKVLEVRKLFDTIDWKCEVKYLYREENLWCYDAVVWWINWFFENIDFWIILEDDCIPTESIFEFCYKINEIYKNNQEIWGISLSNYLTKSKIKEDYLFTKHNPLLWGWATWKNKWVILKEKESIKKQIISWELQINEKWFLTKKALRKYMLGWYWDSDWYSICYFNNLRTIVPKYNQISNIWYLWEHNSRPWKYHNLKPYEINFDISKNIIIIENEEYSNEMLYFIKKMYIYWNMEIILKRTWLFRIIKFIIINTSPLIYKNKFNMHN